MSKIIIIGGVAAGMSAASKAIRLEPDADITVYEKGNFLSYGACGLPYYVSNVNDDYTKMIARTPEQFQSMGIKVRLKHEVMKVYPEDKSVVIRDLVNGNMFVDNYDKLMIATGASPVVPPFPGVNLKNVYTLKTLNDGMILKEALQNENIKNVLIVGAGYIGMELAESMVELHKNVRVVELGSGVLGNFDTEISSIVEKELLKHGVMLNLNESVQEIIGSDEVKAVKTNKGQYDTDLVIICIGVRPNTAFLKNIPLAMEKNGAIIIDRETRTSIPDIYSAGDCAVVYNKVLEENSYIPLGTTANKLGRISGENMIGKHIKFKGTLGSAVAKVLDMEVARTGISEKEAKRFALDYGTVFVKASSHAAYYPDPTPIFIKLIYEKDTKKILGAQMAGQKGVALRIDVFAAAIYNEMTAPELGMLDLCYAPPFAGVWDAINIAANAVK